MRSNPGNIWKPLGIAGVVLLMSLFAGIGVGLYVGLKPNQELDPPNPTEPLPPSDSPLGVFNNAAVAANVAPCSMVGRDVLMDGGNAVDAAIATLFCDGVASIQSMGLGGGFVMTIYNKTRNVAYTVNAREIAPAAATEDMYGGNSTLSQTGGLAVAVPTELKGYWEVYQSFGTLPWERLIAPTIELCENGVVITNYLAGIIERTADAILASESLREILTDANGNLLKEGDRIYRPKLAETLRIISVEGGDAIHNGSLSKIFVEDIQSFGGIITEEDLANYTPRWRPPIKVNLSGGLTAYTMEAPTGGPLLTFMLNVLDGFVPASDEVTTYQRLIEATKYAYGIRTRLGDPFYVDVSELLSNLTSKDFALYIRSQITDNMTFDDPAHYGARTANPENHGTAHINVIDKDGSAVSVTSTVNSILGAKIRSMRTGIILNNEMDDFSSPNITNEWGVQPSPENFIVPGKIPLSSMCPLIVTDSDGNPVLVVGASGGTKITSSVTQVAMRYLWLEQNIKEAIDAPRFHHQIYPMDLQYEFGNLDQIVKGLEQIGHNTTRYSGGSAVNGIARSQEFITANSDYRREGVIAGY